MAAQIYARIDDIESIWRDLKAHQAIADTAVLDRTIHPAVGELNAEHTPHPLAKPGSFAWVSLSEKDASAVMDRSAPFILTLTLDQVAQARLDALRSAHFPPERLVVGAHVTLFHALPGDLPVAAMVCPEATAETMFRVAVSGLRFLGRGVAFVLESVVLLSLRERLRARFADRLTVQDRQPWRPHVTIQNKVQPAVARDLHNRLSAGFVPYTAVGTGLALWIYRDGPWEQAATFAFSKPVL